MAEFTGDYYAALGVHSSASLDEIRRAYRLLAKDLHPDINPQQSSERFQQINEAHRILSDAALRQQYDHALAQAAAMQAFRQRVRGRVPDDVATTVAQAWSKPAAFTTVRRRKPSFRQRYGGILIVGSIACVFWISIWALTRVLIEPAPVLDLSYRGLSEWPRSLDERSHVIERLNLRHNDLAYLPATVGHMTGVILFDVSYNRLTRLPPEISDLLSISGLHLEGNGLTQVPASLGQLPRLRVLNLAYNRLSTLPDEVLMPPELRMIDLTGNPISAEHISHLRALRPGVDIRF